MRNVKKNSGFTLVEIMTSIIVIPLLWFVTYTVLSVNKMLVSHAKHRAQAVFIAQGQLETMRLWPPESSNPQNSTEYNETVTIDDRGTTATSDDLTGGMKSSVSSFNSSCGQATVVVTWKEKTPAGWDKTLTESLTTIISADKAG